MSASADLDPAAAIGEGIHDDAWTRDVGRAHRPAMRLQAETVTLNCQLVFDHAMAFGGYKQSGWGYEFGREGIEAYMQTKTVWAQLKRFFAGPSTS